VTVEQHFCSIFEH